MSGPHTAVRQPGPARLDDPTTAHPQDRDRTPSRKVTARGVIRTYYLISSTYMMSLSLIWGVNTLFLLHSGLDILEVFVVNAAFAASMVLFEIPTGIVADTLGRRASFLVGVAVISVGTAAYVVAAHLGTGISGFVAASVLVGVGHCFYSGAVEAWLVDALDATGFSGGLDRVFARGHVWTGVGMVVGIIGGGLLGTIDLALPFVLRAGLLLPVFVFAVSAMRDHGFSPKGLQPSAMPAEMTAIARTSLRIGWHSRPIRLLMVVSFLQLGFLSWAFYAWQPYFLALLDRDAIWIAGAVGAALALATIIGNLLVDWLGRFCGRRTTLLVWASTVQAGAAIGIGLTRSFWIALGLLALYMATTGVVGPVKSAYLHKMVESTNRATLVSIDALLGNAGAAVGLVALGYVAGTDSIAGGYSAGGLAIMLAVPILLILRRLNRPADLIVGRAGRLRSCADHGLPEIATHTTTAPTA